MLYLLHIIIIRIIFSIVQLQFVLDRYSLDRMHIAIIAVEAKMKEGILNLCVLVEQSI